jgi:putative phosphoesterase
MACCVAKRSRFSNPSWPARLFLFRWRPGRESAAGSEANTIVIVGVISDTHGLMRPQALDALAASELILHAGDIGSPEILEALRQIGPVVAVRGSNDKGPWAQELADAEIVEADGVFFYVLHDAAQLDLDPRAVGFRAVISGHSHRPKVEERKGVLYLNPGSAGPCRFKLPITVARVEVGGGRVSATIVHLAA